MPGQVVGGTQMGGYAPGNMFDGSTGSLTAFGSGGGTWSKSTGNGIPASSSVELFYILRGSSSVSINGNSLGLSEGWQNLSSLFSFPTEITSITMSQNSGNGPDIRAMKVDGKFVVDNAHAGNYPYQTPDSLIDSPTNYEAASASANNGGNYATFNPLSKHSGITLSNGNLDLIGAGNGWKHTQTTIAMKTGKWYCEFGPHLWKDSNSHCQPGVSYMGIANTTEMGLPLPFHRTRTKFFNGQGGAGRHSEVLATNIVGIAFDADTQVWFSLNGVWQGSGNPSAGTNHAGIIDFHPNGYSFGLGMHSATDAPVPMNVGQRPFVYTLPTGFKSLCTQNLDDPLIADPSTAMNVVTYTGDNNTSRTITTGLSPDLVWLKTRNNQGGDWSHRFFDTVRGIDGLSSSSTNAENRYAATCGGVHAFNSDGFTLSQSGKCPLS